MLSDKEALYKTGTGGLSVNQCFQPKPATCNGTLQIAVEGLVPRADLQEQIPDWPSAAVTTLRFGAGELAFKDDMVSMEAAIYRLIAGYVR